MLTRNLSATRQYKKEKCISQSTRFLVQEMGSIIVDGWLRNILKVYSVKNPFLCQLIFKHAAGKKQTVCFKKEQCIVMKQNILYLC